MKQQISLLIAFIFCFSLVTALPVTYKGNITIDGDSESGVVLHIISDLETYQKSFNETYLINVAGTEGESVYFSIWGELVNESIQPIQTSVVDLHLSFNRMNNGASCTNDQACKSRVCCNNVCSADCIPPPPPKRSSSSGTISPEWAKERTYQLIQNKIQNFYSSKYSTKDDLEEILSKLMDYYSRYG